MKLGLLLLAVAVILGGLIGTLIVRDPGYVLVSYGDMALETSLWFALILLIAIYLSLRLLIWILSRSLSGTGRFGSWLRTRKGAQARQKTVRGLLLMAEGQWAEARKVLVAAAREVDSPLINYLSAARAAHELGDPQGRDDLLRSAHESTPGSRLAVGLTQAELQMNGAQWEQCLATLLQLQSTAPSHPQVLDMLCRVYVELEDWRALIGVLPELKKRRIRSGAEFEVLQRRAWCRLYETTEENLEDAWRTMPKEMRKDPEVVAAYAARLHGQGSSEQAETVLRAAIDQNWNETLVDLFGKVTGADPDRQLVTAESWLKARPNDPRLLLALGRICMMNGAWAKAREYFEASLRLQRSTEVYGELGRLCVGLGDLDRGSEYLAQATIALPELPMPVRTA